MKKILFLFLAGILVLILTPSITLAQECKKECGPYEICNPLKVCTFEALINAIINFIFTIAIAIAPLMIIIAGVLFITAAGNPDQIARAKKIIWYTVVGLVIVLLAKGLIAVIEQVIKG